MEIDIREREACGTRERCEDVADLLNVNRTTPYRALAGYGLRDLRAETGKDKSPSRGAESITKLGTLSKTRFKTECPPQCSRFPAR